MNIQSGTILFDILCVIYGGLPYREIRIEAALNCSFNPIQLIQFILFQFHMEYELLQFKREQRKRKTNEK